MIKRVKNIQFDFPPNLGTVTQSFIKDSNLTILCVLNVPLLSDKIQNQFVQILQWLTSFYSVKTIFADDLEENSIYALKLQQGQKLPISPLSQIINHSKTNRFEFALERFIKTDTYLWKYIGVGNNALHNDQITALRSVRNKSTEFIAFFNKIQNKFLLKVLVQLPKELSNVLVMISKDELDIRTLIEFYHYCFKENINLKLFPFFNFLSEEIVFLQKISSDEFNKSANQKANNEAEFLLQFLKKLLPIDDVRELEYLYSQVEKEPNVVTSAYDRKYIFYKKLTQISLRNQVKLDECINLKFIVEIGDFYSALNTLMGQDYPEGCWRLIEAFACEKREKQTDLLIIIQLLRKINSVLRLLKLNETPEDIKNCIRSRINAIELIDEIYQFDTEIKIDVQELERTFESAKTFYHKATIRGKYAVKNVQKWCSDILTEEHIFILFVTGYLKEIIDNELSDSKYNVFYINSIFEPNEDKKIIFENDTNEFYNYMIKTICNKSLLSK